MISGRLVSHQLGSSNVDEFTDTDIIVKGIVPQLPINGGLTIHPETLLSSVHNASWYNYQISLA
jgi:hypothetical protein